MKDLNTYITYCEDVDLLLDAAVDLINPRLLDGDLSELKFKDSPCFSFNFTKDKKVTVCKITCITHYYDTILKPLEQQGLLEFQYCEPGKDYACKEKPLKHKPKSDDKIKSVDKDNKLELK